jgi:hypothetical protein
MVVRLLVPVALLFAVLPCRAANSASSEHEGLLHEIETDSDWYEMYEPVSIVYTVTNVSGSPILIGFAAGDTFVDVLDPSGTWIWRDPLGVVGELHYETLEPAESYVRHSTWDMTNVHVWEPIEDSGMYAARGWINAFYPEDIFWYVDVPFLVTEPAAGLQDEPATWSRVKALYR